MRLGDLDHLKSRIVKTGDPEKDKVADALTRFIDSEETYDNSIQWVKATRFRKFKNLTSCTYGYECSRCKGFEVYKKKFCSYCGGEYNGVPDICLDNRRFSKWRK